MAVVPAAAAAVAAHSQKSMLEICPISSILPSIPHCHLCAPAVIVVVVIVSFTPANNGCSAVSSFALTLETLRNVACSFGTVYSGVLNTRVIQCTVRRTVRYYYSTCNTHPCTTHTYVHVHNVFTNIPPKCVVPIAR